MQYIVTTREVWTQGYKVEASSPEEAIKQVSNQANGTETVDGLCEYSHTLGTDTWTTEEIAIPGTRVRPGYPGDVNDPERYPDDGGYDPDEEEAEIDATAAKENQRNAWQDNADGILSQITGLIQQNAPGYALIAAIHDLTDFIDGEAEEEPIEEYDPGPEIDDEGGMSEYRNYGVNLDNALYE